VAFTRIRRDKTDSYTTVCNAILRDRRLSLKAKGLFTTVMALPDNWDFSVQGLSKIFKEHSQTVYAAIHELRNFGYCTITRVRDSKGLLQGTDYVFFEKPINIKVEPNTENTDMDKVAQPNTEKPDVDNTDMVKHGVKPNTEKPDVDFPPQYKKQRNKETNKKELTAIAVVAEKTDSQILMDRHNQRVGVILDGSAQGKAVKKLLQHFTVEDCIACYDFQVSENWRGNVSWLSVASGSTGITQWIANGRPLLEKLNGNRNGKGSTTLPTLDQVIESRKLTGLKAPPK